MRLIHNLVIKSIPSFLTALNVQVFSATTMTNIPQENWAAFIPADQLDDVIRRYEMANKKF